MILILMVEGARAVISFCIRSAIPGYMVVPPYAEGDHRSGSLHHQDQDHRSSREEVLRMDRWLHPVLPVYLPADVDLQAGVRRVRTLHCPPQVLLNCYLLLTAALLLSTHPWAHAHHLFFLMQAPHLYFFTTLLTQRLFGEEVQMWGLHQKEEVMQAPHLYFFTTLLTQRLF